MNSSFLFFRIWNYDEATLLNSFDNHNFPDKGISKLCLVNELDDSLLLVASCNFCVDCLDDDWMEMFLLIRMLDFL